MKENSFVLYIIKSSANLLKLVAMLELTNKNSSINIYFILLYESEAFKINKKLQIKSLLAVESILLKVACKKFKSLANASRSILNGFPAIAPLFF